MKKSPMKYQASAFCLLFLGCTANMNVEIEKLDFGNGDVAYGVALPIPPYGDGYFVAPDVSSDSENLLRDLHSGWTTLWPELLSSMKQAAKEYDVDLAFEADEFIGMVQHLDDDVFMGDKADVMIGIRPNENAVPEWHFFIRGSEIVHFQPVF